MPVQDAIGLLIRIHIAGHTNYTRCHVYCRAGLSLVRVHIGQARTEAEHMRQECHHLEAQLERKQAQLEELQASYTDVLERLKGQSAALLQALAGGGSSAGAADETALTQVGRLWAAFLAWLPMRNGVPRTVVSCTRTIGLHIRANTAR